MMRYFRSVLVSGAVAMCVSHRVSVAIAQAPPAATQPAASDRSSSIWARAQAAVAPAMLSAPPPIRARDIERYAELLRLSDEQRIYLAAHFEEYQRRCDALETEWLPKLAVARNVDHTQEGTPEFFGAYNQWKQAERGFEEAISIEDEQLFLVLEIVLAEGQRDALSRVRLHRQRASCMPPLWRGLLEAKIDLSSMIERMPWPVEARLAVDDVLIEYEVAFTPLLVKVDKQFWADAVRRSKLRHDARFDANGQRWDRTNPQNKQYIQGLIDQMDQMSAERVESQEPLARVNRQFLPRLVAALPAPEGEAIRQLYLSLSFPRVFPDTIDPEEIVTKVLGDEEVTAEIRAAVEAMWTSYRGGYRSICDEMVDASRRWHRETAGDIPTVKWTSHNQRMNELTDQRDAANAKLIASVRALLPPETKNRYQAAFDEWQRAWEAHERDRLRAKQDAMYIDTR